MTDDWRDDALCAETDPDLFFASIGHADSVTEAKKICLGCEVRQQCLEFALQTNERFGVWGGKSERERRKLRRQLGYFDTDEEDEVEVA
jgi:WhiB family redox-sensing transcriptional regulator